MTAIRKARLRQVSGAGQLACLMWLVVEVWSVMFASPAGADNCSVFTDCFNQANAAAEAAFGLTLLAGFSLLLDLIPVVGEVKGVIQAGTGRDLLTGQELAPWERALGLVPFVPLTDLARGARHFDDVAGVLRHGDDLGDAGRHLDDIGALPSPRPERFDVGPPHRSLVDEYRQPDTTPARRRQISEELGQAGGQRYLQDVTGQPDLTAIRPTADADVAGYADMVADGQAWPHAVEFGGSRATNLVYFDGQTLHVVEAKGGSSGYGDRMSGVVRPGERISQTHPEYPLDVARNMVDSPLSDGRNEIGDAIELAYDAERVRYVGVRTGGRDELLAGQPSTTVEHVFLEPN